MPSISAYTLQPDNPGVTGVGGGGDPSGGAVGVGVGVPVAVGVMVGVKVEVGVGVAVSGGFGDAVKVANKVRVGRGVIVPDKLELSSGDNWAAGTGVQLTSKNKQANRRISRLIIAFFNRNESLSRRS